MPRIPLSTRFLLVGICAILSLPVAAARCQEPGGAGSPQPGANLPATGSVVSGTVSLAATTPPPSSATAQDLGLAAFYRQDFIQAASKFTEASTVDGGFKAAKAYAWLARADLHLHRVDEAEIAARKGVELAPDLPVTQSALAEVYFRQAKFVEMEDILRKLALAKTIDARGYLTLARFYRATANNKAAKAAVDLAHQWDPKDQDILRQWAATLPRSERLQEWKKRLAEGVFDSVREREELETVVSVLEDQEKEPLRACKLATLKLPTETNLMPLTIDAAHLRGFGLLVKVNNTPAKLLIDTGASGVLINSKIAVKAGVIRIAERKIGGIGDKGAAAGYVAFANKLEIGNLAFQDCYVEVMDKKSSLGEDGLLGTDVFSDFLVDLNFPDRKLRLSELPPFPDQPSTAPGLLSSSATVSNSHNRWTPPQYWNFERFYRFGHFLLVPGRINDSAPKLFLVDTGSWDNFITPTAAAGSTKIHSDSDTIVKGLSGKVRNVYSAENVTLTFGHFKQQRYDLMALDLTHQSDNAGTELSGALGFAMLNILDIKIDYRDHLIDFSYDPNRFH